MGVKEVLKQYERQKLAEEVTLTARWVGILVGVRLSSRFDALSQQP